MGARGLVIRDDIAVAELRRFAGRPLAPTRTSRFAALAA